MFRMQPHYTPECLSRYLKTIEQRAYRRFWKYIHKTDTCWLWQGGVDEFGYGRIKIGDAAPRAHRLSYEMAFGPIPDDLVVMHMCDVPACVRPDHLRLGTKDENAKDRDQKRRGGTHGERNVHAKLSADQVREIRRRWTGDYGQMSALCREYGIKAPALYAIVRRTGWKHLEPQD
jgi:hypothetical protein